MILPAIFGITNDGLNLAVNLLLLFLVVLWLALVFWTHAEGIRGRINYSNCANQVPSGGYFQVIQNCNRANFWQLGYGNQFSVIYVLKNAFTDLYGDPNDKQAVARVGQAVLDFDRKMGTTPQCGGYSCTFPAKTIDEIMDGIDMRTGVVAEGNWWAAVLYLDQTRRLMCARKVVS